jgi:prepilin-type processing-associated H-X9-DG protein
MRMKHPFRPRGVIALVAIVLMSSAWSSAADTKPLARYVPKDDLLVYIEFSGLDAHADAWRKTAAYKMLNETPAGAMLIDVLGQTADGLLLNAPEGAKPTGKQLTAAIERFGRSGFVFAAIGKLGPAPPKTLFVFRDAGGKDVGPSVRKLMELSRKGPTPSELVTREDGRKVTIIQGVGPQPEPWAWWFEGDDLVILTGKEAEVDAIVATLAGKRPSALELPRRIELAKTSATGFEPVVVSWCDLAGLPPTPPALGVAGLKGIDYRWGFQGNALVSITRVLAPAPRKGLLALFDQPTFDSTGGLPVPAGLKDFTVVSVDMARVFDQAVEIAKGMNPNSDQQINGMLQMASASLGVPVRDELLAQLGPRLAFYVEPQPTTISFNPYGSFAEWMLHPPKLTILVEVKDAARFAGTLDTLMSVANRQIAARMGGVDRGRDVTFRPLPNGEKGYVLNVPLSTFPLPSNVRPTLMLGKKYLVFAVSPGDARKALAVESAVPAPATEQIAALPPKLTFLSVSDPANTVPDIIANIPFGIQAIAKMMASSPGGPPLSGIQLDIDADRIPTADQIKPFLFPGTLAVTVDDDGVTIVSRDSVPSINPVSAAPVAVALLLPAVQAARTAARRAQSVNNIKQIMLAMHNYHSANDHFPPAAISDAEGKPLLSWRVAILPYIEQGELYNQFHLDEPWDSPHNKPLSEKIPQVYKSTMNQPKAANMTFYQVFTGNGALFDPKGKATGIRDVTDGTSNTIAVVEAGEGVIWSKPDDIEFNPEKDLPKLGGLGFPGGFNVGFGDGSVRFIKNSINPMVLKALITRAGGEVVSADSF